MSKISKEMRKELEKYWGYDFIYDVDSKGCHRMLSCRTIGDLLKKDEDKIENNPRIPQFKCYEVIYDWDDYGHGDGRDAVCLYSDDVGYRQKNEQFNKAYGTRS